jgi:hypothetical protein
MGPAEERDQRREHRLLWVLFGMVVLSALLYLWLVGSHEHVLEISTPEGTVRIISNRPTVRISRPGVRDVQLISHVGYDGSILRSGRIPLVQMEGVGIIRTLMQVELPSSPAPVEFSVTEHEFRLEGGKVQAAGQVWFLKPGTVVEIHVDRLRPEP